VSGGVPVVVVGGGVGIDNRSRDCTWLGLLVRCLLRRGFYWMCRIGKPLGMLCSASDEMCA
jgi:hypothetical protein